MLVYFKFKMQRHKPLGYRAPPSRHYFLVFFPSFQPSSHLKRTRVDIKHNKYSIFHCIKNPQSTILNPQQEAIHHNPQSTAIHSPLESTINRNLLDSNCNSTKYYTKQPISSKAMFHHVQQLALLRL